MKKLLIYIILMSGIVFSSNKLHACHYSFDSKVDQVKIGEVFQVKVTVIYEHRRCVIELEDTKFNLTGLELIGQDEWEMEKRGSYSKMLTLRSIETGKATLEVVRECSKKGISSAEWGIKVAGSEVIAKGETQAVRKQ